MKDEPACQISRLKINLVQTLLSADVQTYRTDCSTRATTTWLHQLSISGARQDRLLRWSLRLSADQARKSDRIWL